MMARGWSTTAYHSIVRGDGSTAIRGDAQRRPRFEAFSVGGVTEGNATGCEFSLGERVVVMKEPGGGMFEVVEGASTMMATMGVG